MQNIKSKRRKFLKRSLIASGSLVSLSALSNNEILTKKSSKPKSLNSSNSTIDTINGLRTIHGNFSDKEIPDDQIKLIINSCLQAANASALQTYSIIVIKDKEKMKKVGHYQGSCMLVFCVDHNRLIASGKRLGYSYFPDQIPSFVTGSVTTAIAAQTAVIAAKSLGIDSLITNSVHRGKMGRHWEILDIPKEYCVPLISVVLGYPDKEPDHDVGRLDGPGVIHNEKYHYVSDEELDEITRKYDDESLHLGLQVNWKEQGHKHYFDWLFKSWLRGTKPATKESQLFKILKKSGYVDLQKV